MTQDDAVPHPAGSSALQRTTVLIRRNPVGPTIPECALEHTGDLDLVNLSDNLAPRDAYVDGHVVTTIPSGGHTIVSAAARVVHDVELGLNDFWCQPRRDPSACR